jgi:hypothetical protein
MISSRLDRRTKANVEALAMIAHAHAELAPHQPRPVRETDECLWESAIEFCAALDRYAGRAMEIKRENRRSPAPMPRAPRRHRSGSVVAFPVKRVARLP